MVVAQLLAVALLDPVEVAVRVEAHLVGVGRDRLAERGGDLLGSGGLSITRPSSVFRRAERGSKLNEPMNTRERSTVKVLACRLEPELPKRPMLSMRMRSGCGLSGLRRIS